MKSIFCHKAKAAPPAANTLRFEFGDQSYSPVTAGVGSSGTWKRCEFMPGNVWDWTSSNFREKFANAFIDPNNSVDIIAAGDTSGITTMFGMFDGSSSLQSICLWDSSNVTSFGNSFRNTSLKKIPLFDTHNVISFNDAFDECTNLEEIPNFDVSSAEYFSTTFYNCVNVKEGALALYNQLKLLEPLPIHVNPFKNCGSNTTTGTAELAQIPVSWGGTKEEV